MSIKGWNDLNPQELIQAINQLGKGSFRDLSYNLVESRLKAASGSLSPDIVTNAEQHLLDIKPRVIHPHIRTK